MSALHQDPRWPAQGDMQLPPTGLAVMQHIEWTLHGQPHGQRLCPGKPGPPCTAKKVIRAANNTGLLDRCVGTEEAGELRVSGCAGQVSGALACGTDV
jgi:hypothetical protein